MIMNLCASGCNVKFRRLIIIIISLIVITPKMMAQGSENLAMELRLRRDFGFGIANLIRGTFSINVDAPEDVIRVVYLIDEMEIGEDRERPFTFRFDTTDYSQGNHSITAIGYTPSGQAVRSNSLSRQFVNSAPTFLIVGGLFVLVVSFRLASSFIVNRGSSKKPSQKYGYLGGAICPNCGKTYSIHWWSMRLAGMR